MPAILDQRLFLPTNPLMRSVDFYTRMGWTKSYEDVRLVLMSLGASQLFLQDYYVEAWAQNTMVHLVVDDARFWCETATRVQKEGGFDEVRIRGPVRENYGALATHVIDPAGVLLLFAEFDRA